MFPPSKDDFLARVLDHSSAIPGRLAEIPLLRDFLINSIPTKGRLTNRTIERPDQEASSSLPGINVTGTRLFLRTFKNRIGHNRLLNST